MVQTPERFTDMLTGGHPNSLGRTEEVVALIEGDPTRLAELYECYQSDDAVVRLRVSNAFKRLCKSHPEWLVPYLDRFINELSELDQPSAQWTLAQLLGMLASRMTPVQHTAAVTVMRRNLEHCSDWIVLSQTAGVLAEWAQHDPMMKRWLEPQLVRLSRDSRRSVAGKARKSLAILKQ